jgi:hypothetical protein
MTNAASHERPERGRAEEDPEEQERERGCGELEEDDALP